MTAQERLDAILEGLASAPGNDLEIEALRKCLKSAFHCTRPEYHETFFARIGDVERLSRSLAEQEAEGVAPGTRFRGGQPR